MFYFTFYKIAPVFQKLSV